MNTKERFKDRSNMTLVDQLKQVFPNKPIIDRKELTQDQWELIRTPGAISHSINPDHLIEQVSSFGNISVKSEDINSDRFLFVHLTSTEKNELILGHKYPGPFCRTFGVAIVFDQDIAAKSSLAEISNEDLEYILEPLSSYMEKSSKGEPFQIHRHGKIAQEVNLRLKELGYSYNIADKTSNKILTILATAWNIRIHLGKLEADLYTFDHSVGSCISELKSNLITPLSPEKKDIKFMVIDTESYDSYK